MAASLRGGSGLAGPWQALVRLHREIESTRWGRLLLSNVWPAYLFALPFLVRLINLVPRLRAGPPDTLHEQALLLQEIVTVVFLGVVVALFAVRAPVVGRRATWRQGAIALAGTVLLNVVAFLPIESEVSTGALLVASTIVVGGTIFTIWSLASLGRCFGLLPEVRGLVTHGPYAWVRHPIYLGEMISALGIVIVRPHAIIVALYVAFVTLQLLRLLNEERALTEAFPEEYPAYRARVARLIPRWR